MPPAERTLRTEAVVLRHSDYGEADRFLVLYTLERGKIRALAKGVRKIHSRKAGHLQPFTRVSLLLAKGRDLWIVTQAETLNAYLPIGASLERTSYASYVMELLDRFGYEEGENRGLYRLLIDTLQRISQEEDLFNAVRYYEIRLLDVLGFRPQLIYCVNCQAEIQAEDQFFSPVLGGILCPKCANQDPAARPISMLALKYFRHFQRSSYADACRARAITPAVRSEMEALMQFYLTYLLERKLNTPTFIREVRGMKKYNPDSDSGK